MITINPAGILSPGSPPFPRAENACRSLGNGSFDEEFSR